MWSVHVKWWSKIILGQRRKWNIFVIKEKKIQQPVLTAIKQLVSLKCDLAAPASSSQPVVVVSGLMECLQDSLYRHAAAAPALLPESRCISCYTVTLFTRLLRALVVANKVSFCSAQIPVLWFILSFNQFRVRFSWEALSRIFFLYYNSIDSHSKNIKVTH